MRAYFCHATLALALCTGAASAQAQTLREPVQLTPQQQTTITRTTVRESLAAPAARHTTKYKKVGTRQNAALSRRSVSVERDGRIVRTTTTERIVTRPTAQTDGLAPPAIDAAPLALTPAQRGAIYRTIVEAPTVPTTVVTRDVGPLAGAPGTIVTAPVIPNAATPAYVEPRSVYVEPADTAPVVSQPVVQETLVAPAVITVGTRIPAATPLYALPAATIAAQPDLGAYRYAMIGDQVMLVDPTSGTVVALLNE